MGTKRQVAPDLTVHVITNDGNKSVHQMSVHQDIQVLDYRVAAFSYSLARFQCICVPQSTHEVGYEKYCFHRWIMIFEYSNLQLHQLRLV